MFTATSHRADPADRAPDEASAPPSAALRRLLERLQRQPDFPALQAAVQGVQRVTRNSHARVQTLADVVRADPAITHRLLRLSNAAHFRAVGGGQVLSIERAIALLGFEAVQHLALRARLLDQLPRHGAGLLLREDYLRALLSAHLAQQLCPDARQLDDSYLVALHQNLGRMVTAAHLPDEALAVRASQPRSQWPLVAGEQAASRQRLGLSYAQLGAQLARRWGWPDSLRSAMRHEPWPLHASPQRSEALRWRGWLANDLADGLLYQAPARWPALCSALADQAGLCTGHSARSLQDALAAARPQLEALAETVGLPLSQLPHWQQPDPLAQAQAQAAADAGRRTGGPTDTALADFLSRHTRALGDALLRADARHEVPRQALQVLWQGLQARRAVLHLGPEGGGGFRPVRVLGLPLRRLGLAVWQVRPGEGHDLFSRLCAGGADSLIDDARRPQIAQHLPPAFVQGLNARHFLVLPIQARGRRLGMIYLDRADDEPFTLDAEAMQLVREVRNQAALALL